MTHLPNGAPIDAIPETLRQLPYWVLWREEPNGRPDKLTKVPYTDRERPAKADDPATWIPFDKALRLWAGLPRYWTGIGCEFGIDTGAPYITGIDFDNCLDPATGIVEPWADDELALLLPTYAEISPSGRGVKVWVETAQPHTLGSKDKDAGQIEVYSSGRFFAVTGRVFEDAPSTIAKVDDAIVAQIIAREQERRQARAAAATPPPRQNGTSAAAASGDPFEAAMCAAENSGAYAPLALPDLVRVLDQLNPARWSAYDDWLTIGMALHDWAGNDPLRQTTARALFDQYSRDRAPDKYGDVDKKWASYGRNGHARRVTVGTLIEWAEIDAPPPPRTSEPPPSEPPPTAAPAGPAATTFHCSDLGNAQRLVQLHGRNVRYVPKWGKWYVWDETRWAEDELKSILLMARDVPRAIYQEAAAVPDDTTRKTLANWALKSESRDRLAAAVSLLETEPGIPVRYTTLDADAWALNCLNGTLDLRSGQLRPHQRSDLLTKRVEIAYNPEATCPGWLAFLRRIFARDIDLISFIQRAVGYTLTADVSEQCLFFEYGTGKNGKSTFSGILQQLLGDYGQQAPSELILMKKTDNVPADVARLVGARLAVTSELEHGRRLAESKVKDLTGGDRLAARFMRQDFFEFAPTHKLWIYGNHKPIIRGSDDGIWRRLRLIPFTVTIPEAERDPQLAEKLAQELPGILAWAVRGCLDWQRHGLHEPQVVLDATAEYRAEMDRIGPFLAECCELGKRLQVTVSELYTAYKLWCVENDEEPVAKRTLSDMLVERGFRQDHNRDGQFWRGIALKR